MQNILPVTYYDFTCRASSHEWELVRLDLESEISKVYSAELHLVSRSLSADVDELLGQRVEVEITRNAHPVVYCGLIVRAQHCGFAGDWTRARVTLVPALAFLGQRMDSRIFQNYSVLDIIRTIFVDSLTPLGGSFLLTTTSRGQEVRDYCVQYNETELDFVERLLREEGISYYFDYDKERNCERFVVFDDKMYCPYAAGSDSKEGFVVGLRNAHLTSDECIERFDVRQQVLPSKVGGIAWNWKNAGILKSEHMVDHRCFLERSLYRSHQRRQDTKDLDSRVADELESIQQNRTLGWGESDIVSLFPGARIRIVNNVVGKLDGEYIVLSVHHQGASHATHYGWGHAASDIEPSASENYSNTFTCIPADSPLRPSDPLNKPRIYGAQTAQVCGPNWGEVCVDQYGRIQVQFAWDRRESESMRHSCWVRVAQSLAGSGWGSQFIPRVGMEAVVEFLDGDPDRPVVTGTVYNGSHPPPFELPNDRAQSGIRTRSTDGSEGFHELRFDDLKGSEEIYLKSQKDLRVEVLDEKSETVKGELRESFEKSQMTTVGENHSRKIGGDQFVEVSGTQETQVHDDARTVHKRRFEHEVGSDYTQKVRGDVKKQYSGSQSQSVQHGLAMSSSAGGVEIDLAQSFDVSSKTVTLRCGTMKIEISPSGINVDGGAAAVSITGGMIRLN